MIELDIWVGPGAGHYDLGYHKEPGSLGYHRSLPRTQNRLQLLMEFDAPRTNFPPEGVLPPSRSFPSILRFQKADTLGTSGSRQMYFFKGL